MPACCPTSQRSIAIRSDEEKEGVSISKQTFKLGVNPPLFILASTSSQHPSTDSQTCDTHMAHGSHLTSLHAENNLEQ
jgi:hypothetical protein